MTQWLTNTNWYSQAPSKLSAGRGSFHPLAFISIRWHTQISISSMLKSASSRTGLNGGKGIGGWGKGMWKMKKYVSLIVCLLLFMCILLPQNTSATSKTQIVDFGHSGEISADFSESVGPMSVSADFYIGGGIKCPIEVEMSYPTTITPGETIEISIEARGMPGEIWYEFNGQADCTVFGYQLYEKSIVFPRTSISMTVPIGDKTSPAKTSQITVMTWHKEIDIILQKYYIDADLRFQFDLEVTTSSSVDGKINYAGSALSSSSSDNYNLNTDYSNNLQISNSAITGDDLDISLSNMKYVLQTIDVKIVEFYVYAGYYSDIDWIGEDSNAITGKIPISELEPIFGTRADDRENGELISTSAEVAILSNLDASISIPEGYYPDDEGGLPFLSATSIIIVIFSVGMFVNIFFKSKKTKQNLPPPKQPIG